MRARRNAADDDGVLMEGSTIVDSEVHALRALISNRDAPPAPSPLPKPKVGTRATRTPPAARAGSKAKSPSRRPAPRRR